MSDDDDRLVDGRTVEDVKSADEQAREDAALDTYMQTFFSHAAKPAAKEEAATHGMAAEEDQRIERYAAQISGA